MSLYYKLVFKVTETELILHQKGKNPIKWPLRSLRKYGWDVDTDVFSIECGRRSPTGPGYYAFKCRKAEQLFNMVQQHIIGELFILLYIIQKRAMGYIYKAKPFESCPHLFLHK